MLYATITVYHWRGHEIGHVKCAGPAEVMEYEAALRACSSIGTLVIQYSTAAVDARLRTAFAMLQRAGYLTKGNTYEHD